MQTGDIHSFSGRTSLCRDGGEANLRGHIRKQTYQKKPTILEKETKVK